MQTYFIQVERRHYNLRRRTTTFPPVYSKQQTFPPTDSQTSRRGSGDPTNDFQNRELIGDFLKEVDDSFLEEVPLSKSSQTATTTTTAAVTKTTPTTASTTTREVAFIEEKEKQNAYQSNAFYNRYSLKSISNVSNYNGQYMVRWYAM